MAKHGTLKKHGFRSRLVLNQWLISLFGIETITEASVDGRKVQPFHQLAEPIKSSSLEGMDYDNLHRFFHALTNSSLFWNESCLLSRQQLLTYEENIVRHTKKINAKRQRPVTWKYYQWLNLLFVEIYLERYFQDKEALLHDLNAYVKRFNSYWKDYEDVPQFGEDDLNKLCLQNATGSGKTLLMHINLLQYRHYATASGRDKDLSRAILLTPNERLSEQHISELRESGIPAGSYISSRGGLFSHAKGLEHVDVLEITKLADQEGPNTIATRSLGDQNLLMVDEGHRGMSGKEEGAWFTRRSELCAKGFTFEYSATFEQAVKASGSKDFEDSYAKAVIFDYSYRWFYEDGFGKDYQILNLPDSYEHVQSLYMTACLLKYYQQLRIFQEDLGSFTSFNLEKPLWVFVGSTVTGGKDANLVVTDVALIIQFIAGFLSNKQDAVHRIDQLLNRSGRDTGLVDSENNDIFDGAFGYLLEAAGRGEPPETIYDDVMRRLFNSNGGAQLILERIKGESGEIALRAGMSEEPFGLINVGDAKGLCDHIEDVASKKGIKVTIEESDFTEAMFLSVKDSASPVNLLIGSKKFVEGWDCWRVSTLGLMHVGQSEGAQIIQLFGRGVRLKGYGWSLKRSAHSGAPTHPPFIEELEILNVFGIKATFMQRFKDFLRSEGLPGNEHRKVIMLPLSVTYDFGKRLSILRPKKRKLDGQEYDFKRDAPVPTLGEVPDYLKRNKVVVDWYPRIQVMRSTSGKASALPEEAVLSSQHLALLDYDSIYFDLEQLKSERGWHNLNITKQAIIALLKDSSWYRLYVPAMLINPESYGDVLTLQNIASELMRRFCWHFYNFKRREYIEPRLELRELGPEDDNIPKEANYQIVANGDEEHVIQSILHLKAYLEKNTGKLPDGGYLNVCMFDRHIFCPLLHIKVEGKISVQPVILNLSEFKFVTDLKEWYDKEASRLSAEGKELFLLRNMSRGKGVGFFEAGNFHPDFILWMLSEKRQLITFIEPHGLVHESPQSEKIMFHKRIKEVQMRLNRQDIVLNSFILSWTDYAQLDWGKSVDELQSEHVLFMNDDAYIKKLVSIMEEAD